MNMIKIKHDSTNKGKKGNKSQKYLYKKILKILQGEMKLIH